MIGDKIDRKRQPVELANKRMDTGIPGYAFASGLKICRGFCVGDVLAV